jgi:hypothetical protein
MPLLVEFEAKADATEHPQSGSPFSKWLRGVLGSIYGRFSEGFDTRDLNEAKALLAQL